MHPSHRRFGQGALRSLLVLTAAAVVLTPLDVAAQGFDVQQFNPMPSQFTNHFTMASTRPLEHFQWEFGLTYNYADDPLVLLNGADERLSSIVASQHTLDIMGGLGLGWFFDFGFDVPLILSQDGEDNGRLRFGSDFSNVAVGVGDVRLVPKFRLFTTETEESPGGVALALLLNTFLPTGDPAFFQGEGFRIEPRLVLDLVHERGSRWSLNLGYMIRTDDTQVTNVEVDDTFTFGMAATLVVNEYFAVVPEIFGEASILADDLSSEEVPLEALLGVKITPVEEFLIQLGGGTGLLDGFGTPDWRLFFTLAVSVIPTRDRDHDGIFDDVDECPDNPEDPDGFQDADGCPDIDNDEDGILDVYDDCPMDPEDRDTFQDEDGCPDPDNDEDGVLDVNDNCPLDPEDRDGWEDLDGCPDVDNDFDGLLDAVDGCPDEPEDFDGFEDENGCPDLDNDQDRILDVNDDCPNEPENYNGFEDQDGCYDESIVSVDCERINIGEPVYFETDSAVIQSRSFNLLNQVADTIIALPNLRLIRVEGHTDDRGSDSYNLDLSQRRANSVRDYLIARAVPSQRLLAVGYGEQHFIANNRSRDGRAQNRRVEFRLLEQEGCPDQAPPPY